MPNITQHGYKIFFHFVTLQTTALDACSQIRERLSEIKGIGEAKLYGLFLTDDGQKGTWLEPSKTLEHYLLRDNVSTISFNVKPVVQFQDTETIDDNYRTRARYTLSRK